MLKYIHLIFLLLGSSAILTAQSEQVFVQKGVASFYADHFHGRKTANGEKYDKYALSAAHKTLAFNSLVRVTNEANQKSVVVRINDRGPFVKGRIIDISRKAAESIDLVRSGTAKVVIELIEGEGEVEEVETPEAVVEALQDEKYKKPGYYKMNGEVIKIKGYTVQAAAFNMLPNAIRFVYTLEKLGLTDIYLQVADGNVFRVLVGDFKQRFAAEKMLTRLKKEGYDGIIRDRIQTK
jgi:rare lipoprotein A